MRRIIELAVMTAALTSGNLRAQNPPPAGAPTQAAPAPLPPNGWRIDRAHSAVGFRVRHLAISWVNGSFSDWAADLIYDPAAPEKASVTARIKVMSVNTNNEGRDRDLRSGRFFQADSFPEIVFTSKSIARSGDKLKITGDLSMHGVTKSLVLDAEVSPVQSGQRGKRVAFTATATIDRTEWDMKFSPIAEGLRAVGDEVRITIDIEATQPSP